jgi:hypothetical protein
MIVYEPGRVDADFLYSIPGLGDGRQVLEHTCSHAIKTGPAEVIAGDELSYLEQTFVNAGSWIDGK